MIQFLLDGFNSHPNDEALIWRNNIYNYRWISDRVKHWREELKQMQVIAGEVVALEADFSPDSISLFLALIEANCILVPMTSSVKNKRDEFIDVAQAERVIRIDDEDNVQIEKLDNTVNHPLYLKLRECRHPGLVLFSSGSTGKSKAALHDMVGILEKFKVQKKKLRAITFLLYDHIGGVNTMLYVLSNAGCIITVSDRKPETVLMLIEKHKVELLPTSPTFINLILISEAYKRFDLSSLQVVTYGTEPMPESTLIKFHELFPHITMQQTYGLSEIGILRSKSKNSESLWVKVGGEGFQTRIVDGLLEIKAASAMLGYLNAPSPFTNDGWFMTNDQVEVDGEYIRILGRKSEIINVGGEKVYPAEVESVIQEIDNVAEVTVFGEKNSIMGNMVCAKVRLLHEEDKKEFALRLKMYCKKKLQPFKIPVKITIDNEQQFSDRFKKKRV
jgi:acyl-coenzyme A synthetase/AMP-(fatty) acid ligase